MVTLSNDDVRDSVIMAVALTRKENVWIKIGIIDESFHTIKDKLVKD